MHFIKSLSIMFLVSLLGMSSTSAGAASFDCNKATTVTEIAICADPKLSALDEGLQIAYRDIFVSNFDDGQFDNKAALSCQLVTSAYYPTSSTLFYRFRPLCNSAFISGLYLL